MAQIIGNSELQYLTGARQHWAYNALDTCVTREVFDVLEPRLTDTTRLTYEFEMACQAPAMAMMRRGVRVDAAGLLRALEELDKDERTSHARCNELIPPGAWEHKRKVTGLCTDGGRHKWPKGEPDETRCCEKCHTPRMAVSGFNPLSHPQGRELLYRQLGIPEHYNKKNIVSVDDDVLERLAEKYPQYAPLINEIRNSRGIRKTIGVLKSDVSTDGRMRSSFNVGAPDTGRWSSSSNPYGEGTNLQNITEKLRYIFVADPGMELVYADLKTGESFCVAYLSEDEQYIKAHLEGDPHTYVARLVWPELPWTGDLKKDRKIAESMNPKWDDLPGHNFRYQAKRIQHGSNYGMTPYGIAMLAHIKVKDAEEAQERYFTAFPGIPAWQKRKIAELERYHSFTSPLGRFRQFFGRHWDKHVQRQFIAAEPQGMVADILDVALCRIWRELDTGLLLPPRTSDPNRLWLLAQVHDAILAEVRAGDDATVERMLELMRVPVPVYGRIMVIGADCKRGPHWRMK